MRKRDMALDYLAPFLARIGSVDKLTRNDAIKVKEECLNDLKQRLIDKANLIQARFEKVNRYSQVQNTLRWLIFARSNFRVFSEFWAKSSRKFWKLTIREMN